jgi:hypothetical protein
MIDWLRVLLMIFYAPLRGMREVRDRGSLAPAAFVAFLAQLAYSFITERFAGAGTFIGGRLIFDLFESAKIVVLVAVVVVPILTLIANNSGIHARCRDDVLRADGSERLRDPMRGNFSLHGTPGAVRRIHDSECGRKSAEVGCWRP